ncbi:MAG: Nucleoid-associated protein YejK [Sodalis sp.]|nr:MAG: Nucleoid-associated protein YejK [Sodalis sp.]
MPRRISITTNGKIFASRYMVSVKKKLQAGEEIVLAALSVTLSPVGKRLQVFSSKQGYVLLEETFPADHSTLRQLTKYPYPEFRCTLVRRAYILGCRDGYLDHKRNTAEFARPTDPSAGN